MCGITAYVGQRAAAPILAEGLRRLEYRGYDSAGVATADRGGLHVLKFQGKIQTLLQAVRRSPPPGTSGIGHTRWATHGAPTDRNSHPHEDCRRRIAVVHNGIIENFAELKQALERKGHLFRSETDTEVIAHLLEEHDRGSLAEALRAVRRELRGQFAVVALSAAEPGTVVGVRQGPPLIAGIGDAENVLASDIPAVLPFTRDIRVLRDGEMVEATAWGVRVTDERGREVRRSIERVTWSVDQAEKGPFETFTLKEIHEQPQALRATLQGRLSGDLSAELAVPDRRLRRIERVHFVGCGTAWHAGLVGRQWMQTMARVPSTAEVASEFRYGDPPLDGRSLVVAVTQSGETADTLAAVELARSRGAAVLSVCNVVGASIPRASDAVFYTRAGPEIGVASTKAYTTQLMALMLLSVHMGRARGVLPAGRARALLDDLARTPEWVRELLDRSGETERCVRDFDGEEGLDGVLFLGRHVNGATALEAALKLKEISYLHAEGYFGGEMKHGPLAMIGPGTPVVAVVPEGPLHPKMVSNVQEAAARGARVVAVAASDVEGVPPERTISLPSCDPLVSPIPAIVPLQLFAYAAAVARGRDVDRPRNLAKSVTVE